jgi:putative peptidoglycan lipid II flippase
MEKAPSQPNRQIARAASTVMFAFTLSQLLGLVRQMLQTNKFGTGAEMDAFVAANSIPFLLFSLVAGGALASAFVPILTTMLEKKETQGAWRLVSALANLVSLVLVVVSAVSAILAPQIVHLIWPNYQQNLTVQLLRILLITSVVFGLSGIVSGILNAHQRFLTPALASSLYWLGWIIGLVLFVPRLGISGLAWGAVLGSLMHLGVQLPDLLKLPKRSYTPTLGLKNAPVREVGLLMGPRLIGVATVQMNLLLNTIIANRLQAGSLAAINYAFPIMTVPLVIIGSGIGFATLPTFSAQVARGETGELKKSIISALRGIIFLSVPAAFGLILLARPLIAALFQAGKFTAQSTDWVAWALILYTIGLVGHATLEVIVRAFYALHDTKTPVIVGASAMTLNLLLSLALVFLFNRIGWLAFGGLAISTSIAAYVESGLLFYLLNRRLKGLPLRELGTGAGAALLGSLVMSGGVLIFLKVIQNAASTRTGNILAAAGGVAIGGTIYGVVLILLRVGEIQQFFQMIWRRLGKLLPSRANPD